MMREESRLPDDWFDKAEKELRRVEVLPRRARSTRRARSSARCSGATSSASGFCGLRW